MASNPDLFPFFSELFPDNNDANDYTQKFHEKGIFTIASLKDLFHGDPSGFNQVVSKGFHRKKIEKALTQQEMGNREDMGKEDGKEAKEDRKEPKEDGKEISVAFISSNPIVCKEGENVTPVVVLQNNLDKDAVSTALKESKRSIKFIEIPRATDDSIDIAILNNCSILHFTGHGDKKSLLFEEVNGEGKIYGREQVDLLLTRNLDNVQLIVLSACQSRQLGEALHSKVPFVICTNRDTYEQEGIKFSEVFYSKLTTCTIVEAFNEAVRSVQSLRIRRKKDETPNPFELFSAQDNPTRINFIEGEFKQINQLEIRLPQMDQNPGSYEYPHTWTYKQNRYSTKMEFFALEAYELLSSLLSEDQVHCTIVEGIDSLETSNFLNLCCHYVQSTMRVHHVIRLDFSVLSDVQNEIDFVVPLEDYSSISWLSEERSIAALVRAITKVCRELSGSVNWVVLDRAEGFETNHYFQRFLRELIEEMNRIIDRVYVGVIIGISSSQARGRDIQSLLRNFCHTHVVDIRSRNLNRKSSRFEEFFEEFIDVLSSLVEYKNKNRLLVLSKLIDKYGHECSSFTRELKNKLKEAMEEMKEEKVQHHRSTTFPALQNSVHYIDLDIEQFFRRLGQDHSVPFSDEEGLLVLNTIFFKKTRSTLALDRMLTLRDFAFLKTSIRLRHKISDPSTAASIKSFYLNWFCEFVERFVHSIGDLWTEKIPNTNDYVISGFVSRQEAEESMRDSEEGTFLIRLSETKPGCLVMSLKTNSKMAHIVMETNLREMSCRVKFEGGSRVVYESCRHFIEDHAPARVYFPSGYEKNKSGVEELEVFEEEKCA